MSQSAAGWRVTFPGGLSSVEVLHPRANRGQEGPLDQLLVGREIGGVARRGKFMWIEFADENLHDPGRDVLFVHLGMSGQMRVGRRTRNMCGSGRR